MWPFRKKSPPTPSTTIKTLDAKIFESIICIPGNWVSWTDFILQVVKATQGEYIAAGNILMHVKNNRHYTVAFCERDERMRESFQVAGSVTRVSDSFLEEIGNHAYVIYISGKTGNLEDAEHIAFAAGAILKAGGIGVKIETTGKAFEKEKWNDYLKTFKQPDLYRMFVVDSIASSDDTVYSCGMQNLGYKDTIISGEEFQYSVRLISIFGFYQIVDKPTIKNMQTFQPDLQSPRFLISDETNQPNKSHDLFENPFGMWRLARL